LALFLPGFVSCSISLFFCFGHCSFFLKIYSLKRSSATRSSLLSFFAPLPPLYFTLPPFIVFLFPSFSSLSCV
jgi:hypothetical protein